MEQVNKSYHINMRDLCKLVSVNSKFSKVLYADQTMLIQELLNSSTNGEYGTKVTQGFLRYAIDDKGLSVKNTLQLNAVLITEKGIYSASVKEISMRSLKLFIHNELNVDRFSNVMEMKKAWFDLGLHSGYYPTELRLDNMLD